MDKIKELKLRRQLKILKSRKSFWEFCKTLEPDFYKDTRTYLKELCDTLQALYEGRIIKYDDYDQWQIVDTLEGLVDYITCNKLMINIPPQHGKSRTLVNFCKWCFGQNHLERVITWSYNDDTANDFSRYTRDGILAKKTFPYEIDYSDIFPNTKIKKGNSSFEKWALEGSHFSYIGSGLNGSITGKSGTIRIVDDPVKDSTEALNENRLEWIWKQYTGTFLSRVSGHYIDIVNHTRWNSKDICGRLLKIQPEKWYVFKREAYDKETDSMLCDELLNKSSYLDIKQLTPIEIFQANYHQTPIDLQGVLYKNLKTYTDIPKDDKGNSIWEQIIAYVDTADTGNDYLCAIVAGIYNKEAYILDVLYTQDGMEITETATAKLLVNNNVNLAQIESNNGGRGFARNVIKIMNGIYKTNKVTVKWFHQSKNKVSRILTNSTFVMNNIYFPINWGDRFPDFYDAITTYQKGGKNKHDDASDCITGIAEMIDTKKKVKAVKSIY